MAVSAHSTEQRNLQDSDQESPSGIVDTWAEYSMPDAEETQTANMGLDSGVSEAPPDFHNDKEGGEPSSDETLNSYHCSERGGLYKKNGRESAKRLGVIWRNLTVEGSGSGRSFVKTFPDAVLGTFGPDLARTMSPLLPGLLRTKTPRIILSDFNGTVRSGEMLLVLGIPDAGCTTFLKTIANNRQSYSDVKGEVFYGKIPASEQSQRYRGEVVYCPEDDVHFPALTVWRTVLFALWNKTKKSDRTTLSDVATTLLHMFGLSHTKDTYVGGATLRGVSGGERKRVSIAETLASKANVICWDNSTRGLDSSTALDFAQSLRKLTDVNGCSTLATLYQTGEGIYSLFDKVLLIHSGRCVYHGPSRGAKRYFEDLGFHCPDRMTTADFLTSVTDPIARRIREGFEHKVPRTAEELERAYRSSSTYREALRDMQEHAEDPSQQDVATDFYKDVLNSKSKFVRAQSPYTVSFYRQVVNCTKREFWLLFNDWEAIYTKAWVILLNAFLVGSLFFGLANDTAGAFGRGGGIFFSVLFLGWVQLPELMKAVSGRTITQRHKDYAFYRPSALSLARAISDAPVLLAETSLFSVAMYFLASFDVDPSKFWIYFLFVFVNTYCTTALYRLFASVSPTIDDAVRYSGVGFNIMIIFTGYIIPKRQLFANSPWFGWLHWISPIAYAFEGVFSNEFSGKTMPCSDADRIPRGPGIESAYQGCLTQGAEPNSLVVTGDSYLDVAYEYKRADLWRNFGLIIVFLVAYTALSAIFAELFPFPESSAGSLQFVKTPRSKRHSQPLPADEESGAQHHETCYTGSDVIAKKLSKPSQVFTWKAIDYTVPFGEHKKKLLNGVSGFAKPGIMIALMGASGAGKTTLLNILSQRHKVGVVLGDLLVNGTPLDSSFKRNTGFCEQMDIHDGTATVREALEFSARLRQPYEIPKEEKLAYVDEVLNLLELEAAEDAIISSLSVDLRKRTTIGVELVAKPSLLFLDEPTSGVDSQSAFSIVHFLKKLTLAGQAVICTIHQPSSVLFEQFDMVLALNPGGNTFYFGEIGPQGKTIVDYFAKRGAQCPPSTNIAEFILETAVKGNTCSDGTTVNWNDEWLKSSERASILEEIDRLSMLSAVSGPKVDKVEFAAPIKQQILLLTKRVMRQYWRDPSYVYGKMFISTIIGIFNGFTFWQLGNSLTDMQNRVFSCFILTIIPSCIVNAILPKFYANMDLWLAREYPSRIYGWLAFTTAQIVAELPYALLQSAIYFLLWYYPAGLPSDSSTAGYVFLMILIFHIYQASWGQWICAWAPSYTVISNILPTFFVVFALFSGIVLPWEQMTAPWKYFLYWATPSTYWVGGIMAAVLHQQPVQCTLSESARFYIPPGSSCESYAGNFAAQTGGYLLPNTTVGLREMECAYCPYSTGDDYLTTINIRAGDKWPYFGIFLAFSISNWFLVYFFIWSVRIKGSSFGIGKVTDFVRKTWSGNNRN
ncbi:abc drug exporter [Alternaria burnsii]|uniref:Abc drug exporter n=1 Tax=Alternaria burnsii TaxID=1187904 RepID=A0A8H7BDA1_9PLEO|nr:abc drug exporter [Alternaria burnsii]KAF7681464.1 abc drug exporter [Alternaria burnsii]